MKKAWLASRRSAEKRLLKVAGSTLLAMAGLAVLLGAATRKPRDPAEIKAALALGPHQGDCERCHSEHGTEGGAIAYPMALIGPDDNALCDQCHTQAWAGGSYAGTLPYTSSSHGTSTSMVWPGPVPPARMEPGAAKKCMNCHDPHGVSDASGQIPDLKLAREENLCLTCHDGGPASTNIMVDVQKPFRHPVTDFSGRHTGPTESTPPDFGATPTNNRHAECEDCHNSHLARSDGGTPPAAPALSKTNFGISRVAVTNSGPGLAPAYTFIAGSDTLAAATEYQLCFKCHSSWTTQPAGQTDLATVLNPANASYHPVEEAGRNTNISAGAFVSPWSATSLTACGDCHGSDSPTSRGPHGSVNQFILRNPYTASPALRTMDPGEICFSCHSHEVYADSTSSELTREASRFNRPNAAWGHAEHLEAGITCYSCHVTHGAATKPHLIATGRTPGIASYTETATGGSCTTLGCHLDTKSYTVNYDR